MSFFWSYFQGAWASGLKSYEATDLKAWNEFLDQAEKDRQRDRILGWKDRVTGDNYAVNADEPEYYRRTAGFVWRVKDPSGTHKARNHQYLYNLEVYGHKVYTRREKSELSKAASSVSDRVSSGDLGPLSPLE